MSEKIILIRADASTNIGLGHVMRCLALQSALQRLNITCIFSFQQMPQALKTLIVNSGGKLFPLRANDLSSDAKETLALASELGAAAILLDGYQFDTNYLKQLHEHGPTLILMDDTNDRGQLYADLLINSLPQAGQLDYKQTISDTELLLGLDYVLLRDEFNNIQGPTTKSSKRKRLLINFGGSDLLGLSLPTTRLLLDKDPQLPITLITGSGFRDVAAGQTLAARQRNIEYIHCCSEMAQQLNRAGLAIASPGATIYELAVCHVPTIFLVCADNQRLSAAAQQELDWCRVIDGRQKNQMSLAVSHAIMLWNAPEKRDAMQEKTFGLIDNLGAHRIAQRIRAISETA
ncbi:MAG: UDP-2,4-diacetamido-2,4,6-trideoxy-beta-L-altropyranose hydrolase [Geopsychrobacter sp.]|nr:UDP-2,4-diacetamido-2,4,6-trideoxy-beta-L-altropyranose hydrolase [Geopsychrobacter sp.]